MAKKTDKSAKGRGLKLVTFEIDVARWKVFRMHALRRDLTASELLRAMVEKELKGRK